jgi:hypothetical protein
MPPASSARCLACSAQEDSRCTQSVVSATGDQTCQYKLVMDQHAPQPGSSNQLLLPAMATPQDPQRCYFTVSMPLPLQCPSTRCSGQSTLHRQHTYGT